VTILQACRYERIPCFFIMNNIDHVLDDGCTQCDARTIIILLGRNCGLSSKIIFYSNYYLCKYFCFLFHFFLHLLSISFLRSSTTFYPFFRYSQYTLCVCFSLFYHIPMYIIILRLLFLHLTIVPQTIITSSLIRTTSTKFLPFPPSAQYHFSS
jgi:hypothetical protein